MTDDLQWIFILELVTDIRPTLREAVVFALMVIWQAI